MLVGQGTNFFGQSMRFQKTMAPADVYFSPTRLQARLLLPATRARVQELIREKMEAQGLGQMVTPGVMDRVMQDVQQHLVPTTAPEPPIYAQPQHGAVEPPEEKKKKLPTWLLPAAAVAGVVALVATG